MSRIRELSDKETWVDSVNNFIIGNQFLYVNVNKDWMFISNHVHENDTKEYISIFFRVPELNEKVRRDFRFHIEKDVLGNWTPLYLGVRSQHYDLMYDGVLERKISCNHPILIEIYNNIIQSPNIRLKLLTEGIKKV